MQNILNYIRQQLAIISEEINGMTPVLYTIAKNNLGNHLTLDPSVPAEVGCAEAVSFCLKSAGVVLPAEGIPGTATLYAFLSASSAFSEVSVWNEGDIIISATGSGNGLIPGHTGIMGGSGIMSNDSNSGLFLELWTLAKWQTYYAQYGGMAIHFFRYTNAGGVK